MSEALFPTAAVVAIYGLLVPLLTLASKLALRGHRVTARDIHAMGSRGAYFLLVAPVVLPTLWFVSAALHESEPGRAIAACAASHLPHEACEGALAFALFTIALVASGFVRTHMRDRVAADHAARLEADAPAARRLRSLCASDPTLAPLVARIRAVEGVSAPVCTRGLLRPRIEVTRELIERLDDRALVGALQHEAQHVRGADPLRNVIAAVALSLNPAARLLRDETSRWRRAREVACDRAAVIAGADPLALADTLLAVARQPEGIAVAGLGSPDARWLRVRVELLMHYASQPPRAERGFATGALAVAVLLTVFLALPHAVDAWPLSGFHHGVERAFIDALRP